MRHAHDLLKTGEDFCISVRARKGALVQVIGHIVGGCPVLLLRSLAGDALEIARLADRADELRQDYQAVRKLLGAVEQPAWIMSTDGQIEWANSCYAAAVGAADPDDVVTDQLRILNETDRSTLLKSVPLAEALCGRFDGRINSCSIHFSVTAARSDRRIFCLARNISELQDMRDELDRQVRSHARTLDSFPMAVAVFDADQRLCLYNAAYADLWKSDDTWLHTKPRYEEILDVQRNDGRLPEQVDYHSWRTLQIEALLRKDGEAQLWYLPDGQTLRVTAKSNALGGATCLYENMTEKFRLESRHNALMNVQKETLDNLSEGVALFASDGRLRFFNPAFARIWSMDPDDLQNSPHIDKIISLSRQVVDDGNVWRMLKQSVTALNDKREAGQIRFELPDGRVLDCAIVPMPDGGTLATYMDVTDSARTERMLREHNEALEKADDIKTSFVSHMSYVLRVPLTTIIGYTDLLTSDPQDSLTDKQREFADHVMASSHALLAIIDDILDLATLESGAVTLKYASVDVMRLMETAAEGLRDRLRASNIDLDISKKGDLSDFMADEMRLKQILFNLLSNALTFSNPGGRIVLYSERQDDKVKIVVKDVGRGIPQLLQSSVFKPFESYSLGTRYHGVGLGLSIVRGLVELHGGDVHLFSEPGEGTTITCLFPLSPPVMKALPTPISNDDVNACLDSDSDLDEKNVSTG